MYNRSPIEVMSPAGSFESLAAALRAGADSVYFGVGELNMRSRSTVNFQVGDLRKIARLCRVSGAKSYLTLNVIIYNKELASMRALCDAAKAAGISAVIASDISVIQYAHQLGLPVHISVQANVCNIESVRFFAAYADVMVLARELPLHEIQQIIAEIKQQNITGPSGGLVRVEVFAHGALCVAVSGKCYMSLGAYNSSANRGACLQNCRRSYRVIDEQTGHELVLDNKYVMSPKDLCTIHVLNQLLAAGVGVLKLEGRGRASDYVATVTAVYKEAVTAWQNSEFCETKSVDWESRLRSVFNRDFWHGGYYLGAAWGEWCQAPSTRATTVKIHVGRVTKFYVQAQVATVLIEAGELAAPCTLLFTGPTTGALTVPDCALRIDSPDGGTVLADSAPQGSTFYVKVPTRVRKNDKVYLVRTRQLTDV